MILNGDPLEEVDCFCAHNRGLGIKANKCGAIVQTALYGTEAWGLRSAKRRKVNVLEMKCLRNLVGVSHMDQLGMKRCVGKMK